MWLPMRWSHLILMTANYPLRWDPVPASCHGDIARASVDAGFAAGNHPDPELAGKLRQTSIAWYDTITPSVCPPPSPPHTHPQSQLVIIKGVVSHLTGSPPAIFSLSLFEQKPQQTKWNMFVPVMFWVLRKPLILSGSYSNESCEEQ